MNSSFWGVFLFVVGLFGVAWIIFFGGTITDNERNYYSLKEITQAAIYDSIDEQVKFQGIGYDGVTKNNSPYMHCENGNMDEYRINREKFVESFIRRFSDTAITNDVNYKVRIKDISECPVLVNVEIDVYEDKSILNRLLTGKKGNDKERNLQVTNSIVAILESKDAFLDSAM